MSVGGESLAPGQTLGPYVVRRELGRGGMGAVYVARHVPLERDVALKVVLEPDPRARERFVREARAAARLRHPAIVAVHDVGQDRGLPYLSMDLVEGESLEHRLARGPLEPLEVARLGAVLADALAHAHGQGVLHRDLKPANVLLDPDGRPLLTDFGLAKLGDEAGALTRTGEVLGTPAFMPPEQADGQGKHVDARADVYGLGATLYAALAGRPPFVGASAVKLLVAVLREPPAPPSSHRPGVPPALDAICLRCLEKEPVRRYPDARALADDLARVARGEEAGLRPARRVPGPVLALVGAGAVLALVVAGVRLAASSGPPPPDPAPAPDPPRPATAPEPATTSAPQPVLPPEDPPDAWTWVERNPPRTPRERDALNAACVFDPGRGRVVLLGGWRLNKGPMDDLWSWDGAAWEPLGIFDGDPRFTHVMVHDAERGELVVIGGADAQSHPLADLWAGSHPAWKPVYPEPNPGPRMDAMAAFAPDRRSVLLFGGGPPSARTEHVWEWDGARWLEHVDEPGPSPRVGSVVAYDPGRRTLVVACGRDRDGRLLDEVWEWRDSRWREGPKGPSARWQPGVAVDGGRLVIFGGDGPAPRGRGLAPLDDTWEYDGRRWRELAPPRRPRARTRMAMAWDPRRRVVVLYGGVSRGELLGDTWELTRR